MGQGLVTPGSCALCSGGVERGEGACKLEPDASLEGYENEFDCFRQSKGAPLNRCVKCWTRVSSLALVRQPCAPLLESSFQGSQRLFRICLFDC